MKLKAITLIAALFASTAGVTLAQRDGGDGERPRRGERERGGDSAGERGGGERARGGRGGPGGFLSRIPVFKGLDENEDGELSEAEIKKATAALMALDKNKDGKLTGEEIMPSFTRGGGGGGGGGRSFGGRSRGGAEGSDRPQRPRRPGTERSERPDSAKEKDE